MKSIRQIYKENENKRYYLRFNIILVLLFCLMLISNYSQANTFQDQIESEQIEEVIQDENTPFFEEEFESETPNEESEYLDVFSN